MLSGDLVGLLFGTALLVILVVSLALLFNRVAAGVIVTGLVILAVGLYVSSDVCNGLEHVANCTRERADPIARRTIWVATPVIAVGIVWTLWSTGTRLSAWVKEDGWQWW